jgi:hypothetical protein
MYFKPETISFSTLSVSEAGIHTHSNVIPTEYSMPSLMVTSVSAAGIPAHPARS